MATSEGDEDVEDDLVVGEEANFMGSQIMKAKFPWASKPAEPGHHVTPSVESFKRIKADYCKVKN
uniref:Uncharacterized protein n=1 Tax=Oryza meridionalis TaxID=40149 RepID=A0A0E0CC54_9ORYZ